ncbi:MAG: ABC transporter ATP-binding protein [Flavobacteriales bacterium]|nr:MAG: ABC transporter ATP-binding protein [Flavobacteriales bacterium]
MQPLLTTQNIVKRYANHTALENVSISVPKQSIFGLLGPNGAGKTSLIRIINQITAPDEGEVFINGEKLRQKHIENIGYLPEERGLYKKMKVGEQALYLAQLKGMSKSDALRKLKEWFEKFDIATWWNKKVEELSKGMQQKIQFIITVLHEPELLILDEPFTGFDPINTQLIKDEILQLRKNGATVIFSTHNMASVEEICDHIVLINKAKTILEGAVSDIKNTYKSNVYEIEFKGNMMAFTNAMWTGGELLEKAEKNGTSKVKIKLLGNHKPNDLLQAIIQHVEVQSLNEIIPSMNDIFIQKVTEIKEEIQ